MAHVSRTLQERNRLSVPRDIRPGMFDLTTRCSCFNNCNMSLQRADKWPVTLERIIGARSGEIIAALEMWL